MITFEKHTYLIYLTSKTTGVHTIMQDYTLMIQARIKQEEAQKDKNQRQLVREFENARRNEGNNRDGKSGQSIPLTHQDSHN